MIDEAILEAMHRSFGGSVKKVLLPRLGRTLVFREPNVGEQKTFSKIVLAYPDSHSVVYAATLALMKKLALDPDFPSLPLNEMERIVVLANLFSANFLTKQISVTCPAKGCGHQFVQSIRHGELLRGIERISTEDFVWENATDIGTVRAHLNYPSTKKYLGFLEFVEGQTAAAADKAAKAAAAPDKYEQLDHAFDDMSSVGASPSVSPSNREDGKVAEMIAKRKASLKPSAESRSRAAGNIDIAAINSRFMSLNSADIYIRKLEWKVNGDPTDYVVTFDDGITFEETERILAGFPSSFFTDADGRTLAECTARELYRRTGAAVPEVKCPKCGLVLTENVSLYDFFIAG